MQETNLSRRRASAGRRIAVTLGALALIAALPVAFADAKAHTSSEHAHKTTVTHNPRGAILGAIPVRKPGTAPPPDSLGRLDYHNGPVMHSAKLFAIFWQPPGTANYIPPAYKAAITTYLSDTAHDSFHQTNVFSVGEQYTDTTGNNAAYNVAYGGAVTDPAAFPANGCPAYSDSNFVTHTVCLTAAQLSAKVSSVITAHSWPRGLGAEYLLFTPPAIGSCDDATGTSCAYTVYCAFHSNGGSGSSQFLWANEPFVGGVPGCRVGENISGGDYPNGDISDDTISTASHEVNETMTDPLGTAWWDSNTGEENGDKCAYNTGTTITGPLDVFNQVVNGNEYLVQQEWDNRTISCLQKNPNKAPTGVTVSVTPTSPTHGVAASFKATATDADGIKKYAWNFGDGVGATTTSSTISHTYTTAGSKAVTLIVTDNKLSATKAAKTVVVG